MVESINQIQITSLSKARLYMEHGNQPYTYWELMTACGVRVFLNASYEDLKSDYSIIMSTMEIHLKKICPPLQCRNMRHLHKMINIGEVQGSNLK